MTAPTATVTDAVAAAYLAATASLRARLLVIVATLFGQDGYRDAGADAFVASVVPVALAAQQTTAALTDAYLTHLVGAAGGAAAPVGVATDEVTGAALRGVDPAIVYRRPFVQVWTDLSQGKPFEDAVVAGARRAGSIAATDLQLAKTHATQLVLGRNDRVTGYRRVLTGPHSCALCVLASTVRYHKASLMPIHPGCDCSVEPLFGGEIPDALPAERLHAVVAWDLGGKYVQAGGRGPVDYRDIVVTHDHSEIGPVLGVRGQHFDGPADIPRA